MYEWLPAFLKEEEIPKYNGYYFNFTVYKVCFSSHNIMFVTSVFDCRKRAGERPRELDGLGLIVLVVLIGI